MDIKRLAERLVDKHGTRDPFRIAEELGYTIIHTPLVGVRGFYQYLKRCHIIYLDSELDEATARFVCAHELGHTASLSAGNCHGAEPTFDPALLPAADNRPAASRGGPPSRRHPSNATFNTKSCLLATYITHLSAADFCDNRYIYHNSDTPHSPLLPPNHKTDKTVSQHGGVYIIAIHILSFHAKFLLYIIGLCSEYIEIWCFRINVS